jgi:uncharacterized protein with von Willebrand factor type A (vWA) domain
MKWLSRLKKGSTTDTTDRVPKEKIIKEPQEGIDKLKVEPQAKTISEMLSKKNTKKTIKELQKELDELIEEHIKMELRPCRGDTDLRQREKDLEMLEEKIRAVEKDLNKYIYPL